MRSRARQTALEMTPAYSTGSASAVTISISDDAGLAAVFRFQVYSPKVAEVAKAIISARFVAAIVAKFFSAPRTLRPSTAPAVRNEAND